MTDTPNNFVPDYGRPAKLESRPVSLVASASIILPLVYVLVVRGIFDLSDPRFDQSLGLSAKGTFWAKLTLFDAFPFFCIFLAVWSIFHIRKNPPLSGIHIAIIAILLNVCIVAYQADTIYHLYNGYFR